MEDSETEILVKSEKISQKKKVLFVWAITLLLIIVTMISFVIDYSGYKKGQKFGLASAVVASEIGGTSWIDKDDSYAEQCKAVYSRLNRHTSDITINGVRYDASEVRKTESALRATFADVMESAGYDRYSSYSIANWFKYTNFVEYFVGDYLTNTLPSCSIIVLVLAIVFSIIVNQKAKKEIVVYEDSVLCRLNSKKSKQLVFEDINNVDFGKNTLKIVGTGVKFKISNIINAEDIKTAIIDKKKSTQNKVNDSNIGNADELRKYKELLDCGVISQEEFDAKKKQILGI